MKLSNKNLNQERSMDMSIMDLICTLSSLQGCLSQQSSGTTIELTLKESKNNTHYRSKSSRSYKSLTGIKRWKQAPMVKKTRCICSRNGPFSEARAVINIISGIELSDNSQNPIRKWLKNITDQFLNSFVLYYSYINHSLSDYRQLFILFKDKSNLNYQILITT